MNIAPEFQIPTSLRLRLRVINVWFLSFSYFLAPQPGAKAQGVPTLVNYQGQLSNPDGSPIPTGDYKLTFSIYNSPQGGNLLWGPQIFDGQQGTPGHVAKVPVVQGYFNVVLGPSDANNPPRSLAAAFAGPDAYVEIKVGDNPPVAPRQRILSAPYALQSASARQAESATLALNASKLANADWSAVFDNGNPTTGKIPGSKLASKSVDGDKFSGGIINGTSLGINGTNGNLNVLLGAVPNFPDLGILQLYDAAGQARLQAYVGEGGGGGLKTFGPAGSATAVLDPNLAWPDYGRLSLYAPSGLKLNAFVTPSGEGTLRTYGPGGNPTTTLGGLSDRGTMMLYDTNGAPRLQAYVSGSGFGGLTTYGPNGTQNIRLDSYLDNFGRLQILDQNDKIRAEVYAAGNGYGAVALFSPNDSFNVYCGPSAANENYGQVTVYNESSVLKASIFVDKDGAGAVVRDREYTSSDRRLKEDIQPIDGALRTVQKLRGVSFTRKSGSESRGRELGVIAQEVREAIPEAVVALEANQFIPKRVKQHENATRKESPSLYVDYTAIVAVLIEAVKQQQAQIDSLNDRILRLQEGPR